MASDSDSDSLDHIFYHRSTGTWLRDHGGEGHLISFHIPESEIEEEEKIGAIFPKNVKFTNPWKVGKFYLFILGPHLDPGWKKIGENVKILQFTLGEKTEVKTTRTIKVTLEHNNSRKNNSNADQPTQPSHAKIKIEQLEKLRKAEKNDEVYISLIEAWKYIDNARGQTLKETISLFNNANRQRKHGEKKIAAEWDEIKKELRNLWNMSNNATKVANTILGYMTITVEVSKDKPLNQEFAYPAFFRLDVPTIGKPSLRLLWGAYSTKFKNLFPDRLRMRTAEDRNKIAPFQLTLEGMKDRYAIQIFNSVDVKDEYSMEAIVYGHASETYKEIAKDWSGKLHKTGHKLLDTNFTKSHLRFTAEQIEQAEEGTSDKDFFRKTFLHFITEHIEQV